MAGAISFLAAMASSVSVKVSMLAGLLVKSAPFAGLGERGWVHGIAYLARSALYRNLLLGQDALLCASLDVDNPPGSAFGIPFFDEAANLAVESDDAVSHLYVNVGRVNCTVTHKFVQNVLLQLKSVLMISFQFIWVKLWPARMARIYLCVCALLAFAHLCDTAFPLRGALPALWNQRICFGAGMLLLQ